ncbi:MAG: hypothetical protein ACE5KW_03320 [Dehalococcoidia bacterium]
MGSIAEESQPTEGGDKSLRREAGGRRGVIQRLWRYLTPRLGIAIVLWRLEAWLATPVALALVVVLGRWAGALTMGAIMAAFAFIFLILLDRERAVVELSQWAYGRGPVRRYLRPIAERPGRSGTLLRVMAVPLVIIFTGPFWRAVVLTLFQMQRLPAYLISVGGSIPHSLLWYGVVLGGIWERLVWPLLDSRLL